MARKAKQVEMFEQKKIAAIERYVDKADERREQITALEGEKENFEFKIRELMHANEADLDKQESEDGDQLIIYKRGDYSVVIKRGKEKVNYKRKADAHGEPVDDPQGGEAAE